MKVSTATRMPIISVFLLLKCMFFIFVNHNVQPNKITFMNKLRADWKIGMLTAFRYRVDHTSLLAFDIRRLKHTKLYWSTVVAIVVVIVAVVAVCQKRQILKVGRTFIVWLRMYQSWWPCGIRHMPKDYAGNQQGLNGVVVKPVLCYICVFARYSSFKMITRFELSDLTMQT